MNIKQSSKLKQNDDSIGIDMDFFSSPEAFHVSNVLTVPPLQPITFSFSFLKRDWKSVGGFFFLQLKGRAVKRGWEGHWGTCYDG